MAIFFGGIMSKKTPVYSFRVTPLVRKVNKRGGPTDAEMTAGYKKQSDSYAQAGDSSPARKAVIRPTKKKRKM